MDVDYDDMIEDYIQEANDEPPPDEIDYEESLLEEMLAAESRDQPTAAPSPTLNTSLTTSMELINDDLDSFDADSLSERNRSSEIRTSSSDDPFAFERYNGATAWRDDRPKSPDGMKATKWKTHRWINGISNVEADSLDLIGTVARPSRRAQAADVQLMEFMRPPRQLIHIRALRYKYGSPVLGSKCSSMTLGGGMRVYFPANEKVTAKHTKETEGKSVLGISMVDLMRRVNLTRRRKEHEHQQSAEDLHLGEPQPVVEDEDGDESESGKLEAPHLAKENLAKQEGNDMLWVDKHAPATFAHLLSDERTNREVLRALRAWDPYVFQKEPPPRPQMEFAKVDADTKRDAIHQKKKGSDLRPDESVRVILMSGPAGIGKTTLAHIIARHAGYRPIEVNGSDERSASVLTERLVSAMESSTLNFSETERRDGKSRPNCIIMDEIDGADAKGAVKALVDIIRASPPSKKTKRMTFLRRPIIFICNNKWAPALKPLLPFAKQFDLSPPTTMRLISRLQAILKMEGLTVSGGSSMLNNLVTLSGGDIRSCIYTMQFAAYQARELSAGNTTLTGNSSKSFSVDIGDALFEALGGNGLKDERKDVAGTVSVIFRKQKETNSQRAKGQSHSTDRVMRAVTTFGDSSRVLDSMFLNIARVSYIDPAFDRCALAQEWLSVSDTYRSQNSLSTTGAMISVQDHHIPTTAAALHLLCRVEQRSDLTYTVRDFYDHQFKHENNQSLVKRFAEGISLQSRSSRSAYLLVSEFIPYSLQILSSGQGTGSLNRAVASIELLNANELSSFHRHGMVLHSLGLTYACLEEAPSRDYCFSQKHAAATLDPPIHQLVEYVGMDTCVGCEKREIPAAVSYRTFICD
ncbi:hypothetical protein MPSEU_000492000 [Mayamaea pseudoterrestris]|nr:hypothetical protein MPSEU_000492000 [Mayamaea pseudoterrestris]